VKIRVVRRSAPEPQDARHPTRRLVEARRTARPLQA
jgi:hypothetical protein